MMQVDCFSVKKETKPPREKVEEVVPCKDEQVLVDFLLFDGEEDVPHRPEPVGVVG